MRVFQLFLFLGLGVFLAQSNAHAEIVEFSIAPNTGAFSWNTEETMVRVRIGDTLRIYNDDTVVHQLHTNGSPCRHGSAISPGSYWDCEISRPYDSMARGPLYDHRYGPNAKFWLITE